MDAPPLALYAATAACTAALLAATPLAALVPAAARAAHGVSKPRGWGDCVRAFSGVGWSLWTAAVVASARGLAGAPLTAWASALADPAREVALTGAAAAATGALLFMVAAAVAGSTSAGAAPARPGAPPPPSSKGVARPPPPRRRHPALLHLTPGTAAVAVAALSCAWAAAGSAFILAAPSLAGPAARGVYVAAAGACLAGGAGTTHGFGGRLRARALAAGGRQQRAGGGGWAFVQPGRGGRAFVAAQAGAWALTGGAAAGLLALGRAAAAAAATAPPGGRTVALLTSGALAAGQLVLAASLWAWRGAPPPPPAGAAGAAAPAPARPPARVPRAAAAAAAALFWWAPLVILYAPIHALLAGAAASFALLPLRPAACAAAWGVGTAAAYALTERGDPAGTGCREWPAFRAWMARAAFPALARAGCPFEVIHDDGRGPVPGPPPPPAPPKAGADDDDAGGGGAGAGAGAGHPVFALAPHGLYPAGAVLLALHPALRAAARGAPVSVLAASAVLRAPVIRDLAAWAGVRSVSRPVAEATLAARPVLLIPGGQAEMVHTWRLAPPRRELVLVRGRRTGFVRLAVAARSPLIPVLALGEAGAHRELLPAPRLKAAAVRALGFPIPYWPLGRWAGPLPRRGPLRFVVGPPVWPAWEAGRGGGGGGGVDEAAVVRATHAAFYEALAGLVARHAPEVELVWED